MTDLMDNDRAQQELEEWFASWDNISDVFHRYDQLIDSGMPKKRVIKELALSRPKQINPKHLRLYIEKIEHDRAMNSIANMGSDV
jgi:hypothetical protein